MRPTVLSRLFLCSTVITLISCGSEGGTSTTPTALPSGPGVLLATPGSNCDPGDTHPSGNIVDSIGTPSTFGIAVREDGLAYATEPDLSGVGIIDSKNKVVTGFIHTGSIPTGVAFSPDGNTAFVTNQGDQNVSVIDVPTSTVVANIFTPAGSPLVSRVSPDGTQLFVATASTTVEIVDIASRTITATAEVGFIPNGLVAAPDGRIMYVSAAASGTVTEIDIFSHLVLRTFTVGGTPQDMAITKDGKRLYVGNEAGSLQEITLSTGTITATIPLTAGAFGIGVTADDGQAFVSEPSAGLVQSFNLQSHHLAKNYTVHGTPRRVGFSKQGHIGAVANQAGFVTFIR